MLTQIHSGKGMCKSWGDTRFVLQETLALCRLDAHEGEEPPSAPSPALTGTPEQSRTPATYRHLGATRPLIIARNPNHPHPPLHPGGMRTPSTRRHRSPEGRVVCPLSKHTKTF